MVDLTIDDDIAERLRRIAEQENRPMGAVLRSLLDLYPTLPDQPPPEHDPLDDFIGAFDDDVPDISSTVRETMEAYYRQKYGNSH